MNIAQLLKTKDVQLVMFEFTSMYKPSMTSEEFLKSTVLQMRVGAFLGRKAGNALGFRVFLVKTSHSLTTLLLPV